MATVYSLVCWGGRTGKTVTASNSSGLIFTTSGAHGLRDGTELQFVATTLPGNVSAGTTYYAKSLTSTTFAIYTDASLTSRVAWSSAGSAVYAKSKKMLDYFAQYPNRWGDAGAERCYDGLASFQAGRVNNAVSTVSDFCELGEAFDEYPSAKLTLNIPAYETIVEPTVNGAWTSAWHGGVYGAGYRFVRRDIEREFGRWILVELLPKFAEIAHGRDSVANPCRLERGQTVVTALRSSGTPTSRILCEVIDHQLRLGDMRAGLRS